MGGNSSSPSSSSRESCSHPAPSSASSAFQPRGDLSTELKLGLSLSASSSLTERNRSKEASQSTIEDNVDQSNSKTLFVKVYMEGIPIGRKLDLLAHNGYDGLITTLRSMFKVKIICPDICQVPPEKTHVLTYEDKEGDWMMVGDVPWELFLLTVKKLKITRADKC